MFMNSLIHLLEVTTLLLVGFLIVQVYRCYLNYNRAQDAQSRVGTSAPAAYSLSVQVNIPSNVALSPYTKSSTPLEADVAMPVSEGSGLLASVDEPAVKFQEESIPVVDKAADVSLPETVNDQILNDYIGEFFVEASQPDISAYRQPSNAVEIEFEGESCIDTGSEGHAEIAGSLAKENAPDECVASKKIDEQSDSDDIIIVDTGEPLVPVILEELSGLASDGDDCDIPVLTDLSNACIDELDDDSVITVLAERDGRSSETNVMSDKVVHAMLDEARLVCAS